MKTVHKSVLIWYTPAQMFALVADVARYPDFLPWCDHATVLKNDPQGMQAEIGLSFAGIRQAFTTRNTHQPHEHIDMQLVNGPFSHLDGQWQFKSVGDAGEPGCKVTFTLHYAFKSATLGALIGPVFDKIAASLVDAFVKRAQQVYG